MFRLNMYIYIIFIHPTTSHSLQSLSSGRNIDFNLHDPKSHPKSTFQSPHWGRPTSAHSFKPLPQSSPNPFVVVFSSFLFFFFSFFLFFFFLFFSLSLSLPPLPLFTSISVPLPPPPYNTRHYQIPHSLMWLCFQKSRITSVSTYHLMPQSSKSKSVFFIHPKMTLADQNQISPNHSRPLKLTWNGNESNRYQCPKSFPSFSAYNILGKWGTSVSMTENGNSRHSSD